MSAGNRGQLADFLRSRRARLTPADVGLPADSEPGRRRTPGLRREEVAELSGVGVTWYTWLEQGRKITASPQVVDALARALRLSADEHRHLRELAGLAAAPPVPGDDPQARLQRLVDAAAPNAASVYDVHFDYLAWNEPYRRIRHDPAGLPAGRRNLLWMMFTDAENRARMTTWDRAARTLLSQFRAAAGRHPGDARFAELTAALTEAGCANGLLKESVAAWCAERGLAVEPDGVDISPALAELARGRLPLRAARIWTGNAVDWRPPGQMRFDYVHILLDCVPRARRADLVRHHLAHTVRPGTGRLLVSDYAADPAAGHPAAAETLRSLGFRIAGQTSGGDRPGRAAPTAWINVDPAAASPS